MNQHNTEVSELVRQNIGNVLQCVFDTGSKYGRTTIARILTGTVDVRILTANSEAYGSMKAFIIKDVLEVIDWAIENNYLAYVEDSEFPVLVCTSKGLNVLSGYDKTFSLPMDRPVQYDNEDKEKAKKKEDNQGQEAGNV